MRNGVINIYKEAGVTSFHVVSVIRRLLGGKKTGHTGTLDPGARGVLPVCIGKATKLVDFLADKPKCYKAVMLLGKRTDTQDCFGKALEEIPEDEVIKRLSLFSSPEEKIREAFESFTGEIEQVPPMYSALKVKGVKLVDAARKGITIERKGRARRIYSFENIEISDDFLHVSFEVRCSKGTYIRTLAEDLGAYLGVPSCLLDLERTETSGLKADDSITLDEFKALYKEGRAEEKIIPIDYFLKDYSALTIRNTEVSALKSGNPLGLPAFLNGGFNFKDSEIFRIYDEDGVFYALYRFDPVKNVLLAEKMFV